MEDTKVPQSVEKDNAAAEGKNSIFKKISKKVLFGAVAIVVVAVATLVVVFAPSGKTTISAESVLKAIQENQEVSTVEYDYKSIVDVKSDDGKKTLYHVAYEGTVKLGFDLEQVKVELTDKNLIVTIPEIKVNSVSVDEKSLDFIFVDKKSKRDETLLQKAYKKCTDHLTKNAQKNETLFEMAEDNAIETMKALIKPFESQIGERTIEVKCANSKGAK